MTVLVVESLISTNQTKASRSVTGFLTHNGASTTVMRRFSIYFFIASCALTRIRTSDRLLKRELLYQLSYKGIALRISMACDNFQDSLLRMDKKCNRDDDVGDHELDAFQPIAFAIFDHEIYDNNGEKDAY